MPQFQISSELIRQIADHAREEMPRECCGLISGVDGVASTFFRIGNTEAGNRMYVFDPDDQYAAERAIDRQGESVVAVYHSHPVTQAYPSVTDIEYAYWPESDDLVYPDAVHLICSMADPGNPVVRGFRLSRELIEEVDLIQG